MIKAGSHSAVTRQACSVYLVIKAGSHSVVTRQACSVYLVIKAGSHSTVTRQACSVYNSDQSCFTQRCDTSGL